MQLTYLHIRNFKSIRDMEIHDIDRALILVGKNNTGKTSVLDAVCAVCGCYDIQERDFNERKQAIRIDVSFYIGEEDLRLFHRMGTVSQYRRYDVWSRVFSERLPSFQKGELSFTFHVNQDGKVRYEDLYRKSNPYIPMVLPRIYRINAERELNQLQNDLLMFQEDQERYSVVRPRTNMSEILDDLGYGANDLLNVSFVFIVEGKQDKSRLPLLLEKYYSEIYGEDGNLYRISIITTNSCTNIKTYANLKYMNQVYLRDQFLMIRDGDGMDPEELVSQLCRYYDERNEEDVDRLPKVTRRNVLILKYYSFENYFFNPSIMARLGIVESEEGFYKTLYEKWREYLYRIRSGQHLTKALGRDFTSPEDMKEHMEEVRIYLRGHNLYDIFYGPFREKEKEILKAYIELAPREEFKDILDAIDRFVYFDSRKKTES